MSTNAILVDTSAWYALFDKSDSHHENAQTFLTSHVEKFQWVTTQAILWETWVLLQGRLGRGVATAYWEHMRNSNMNVIPLEPSDLEAAWHIIQKFSDQDFSLVDCATFAIMERLGISQAFTFDHHFLIYRYGSSRQNAFICLP